MNLIDAIQALSLREKEELYSHIGKLIQEEKFYKEEERVRKMEKDERVRKMEEVKMSVCAAMNLTTYDPRSRERQNVIVRIITANIFLRMGYTEDSIGKAMRKDHSTIHHYKEIMNTWIKYPGFYKEELTIWNQIKKEYEIDQRTI